MRTRKIKGRTSDRDDREKREGHHLQEDAGEEDLCAYVAELEGGLVGCETAAGGLKGH